MNGVSPMNERRVIDARSRFEAERARFLVLLDWL